VSLKLLVAGSHSHLCAILIHVALLPWLDLAEFPRYQHGLWTCKHRWV
jgi:hypothetical protein